MSLFTKVFKRIRRPAAKTMVVAAAYAVLLAGTVGLGLASRGNSTAATIRDCDTNSIDYKNLNGGCGAADRNEFVADAKGNNPNDLQNIYNRFGLSTAEYDRFKSTAQQGMAYRDGRIVVAGQTVMTNAWSIGRAKFSYSTAYPSINSKTYYKSMHTKVLKQDLPVMVMFNDQGEVEFFALNACGNPGGGNQVDNSVACKALNAKQDATNPNKYSFTTTTAVGGNAKISRVVYNFGDGTPEVTKTGESAGSQTVEHTFTKSADVTVTVYAKVPGGKEIKAAIGNCKKHIDFQTPVFACVLLTATTPDPKDLTKFRFTLTVSHGDKVTLKNADFTLDNSVTTKGVTTKDNDGKLYKEYTFDDEKTHTVKATAFFDTFNGVKSASSDKCAAQVKAKQIPKCEKNPELPECKPPKECKPGIPEGDARCTECKPGIPQGDARCTNTECKPGIPQGDKRCNPPEECKPGILKGSDECNPPVLTNTGPGSIAGLFAGTSVLGTAAHAVYSKRKAARKSTEAVDEYDYDSL